MKKSQALDFNLQHLILSNIFIFKENFKLVVNSSRYLISRPHLETDLRTSQVQPHHQEAIRPEEGGVDSRRRERAQHVQRHL